MFFFRIICSVSAEMFADRINIPLNHIIFIPVFLRSHSDHLAKLLYKWLWEEKESLLAISIME